jgi:hypothetical protein
LFCVYYILFYFLCRTPHFLIVFYLSSIDMWSVRILHVNIVDSLYYIFIVYNACSEFLVFFSVVVKWKNLYVYTLFVLLIGLIIFSRYVFSVLILVYWCQIWVSCLELINTILRTIISFSSTFIHVGSIENHSLQCR